MLEFLEPLMQNFYARILVFVIFLALLVLVITLVAKIAKKRNPLKYLSNVLWKMNVEKEKKEVSTIDDVYHSVMESIKREGFLMQKDREGFLSRKKILKALPDGPKKDVLKELFLLYETKHYGKGGIRNEARVAADILDRYAHL
jgi:hypothetical protein